MDILDQINNHKRTEIAEAKSKVSLEQLKESPYFNRKTNSLKAALLAEGASGIIAEFKTQSPSKGVINAEVEASEVTAAYVAAGASGLSVLTDERFFWRFFRESGFSSMGQQKYAHSSQRLYARSIPNL